MYIQNRKKSASKFLNSKLIFVVSIVVLIAITFGLSKIIYKRIQVNKEISTLDQKITELEESNSELTNLIDYLNTDAFQEKTARTELGLRKPDENVAVIVKGAELNSAEEEDPQENLSNPQKWLQYFFN